ncbi:MAG TPA: hypothetical protein VHR66_25070 [Gemmataceae bacterium]|nr:hypothetical protein [Gemmataceae bacterium]
MTSQEYVDLNLFSVTTQPGLNLLQQLQIDAFNFDQMNEAREEQRPFDTEQEAAWLEFEAKRPHMVRLAHEAVAKK